MWWWGRWCEHRLGWNPEVGSGLTFQDRSEMQDLEFLRLEDNVEVFLNKKTGKEVFIGRTSTPVDSMFSLASGVITDHYESKPYLNLWCDQRE